MKVEQDPPLDFQITRVASNSKNLQLAESPSVNNLSQSPSLPPEEQSMPVEQNMNLDFLNIITHKQTARKLHQNFIKRTSDQSIVRQKTEIDSQISHISSYHRTAAQVSEEKSNQALELLRFFEEIDGPAGFSYAYQKRQVYKFMTQLVKDATELFPQNIDLRIIGAQIYLTKLSNEFKAIFEIMSCELYNPSIYDQFIIFRKKLDIEVILYNNHQKLNSKQGFIDVLQVFNYQRLYLQYQVHEYLTVLATQGFWRELLARHIDASHLQKRGKEISKHFLIIQDILKECKSIYPDDIKLMCRHGFFLLNVVNNDSDAMTNFDQATQVFQNKIYKKKYNNNEQQIFGENTASAVLILAATAQHLGKVVDVNEELEHMLGFTRREVVGKNINLIIPSPLGKKHDRLIQRYFETAKPTVIEIQRQSLACNKLGYLREVQLLVKVYPLLTNQIMFVGFMQRGTRFDDIQQPKLEYDGYEQCYIMTDEYGNISNVSEGLHRECGLHAKFFFDTGSAFQSKINIASLFPDIHAGYNQDGLNQDGALLNLDTRNLLGQVELECLNSEEIIEVKSCIGIYQVLLQHKEFRIDPRFCVVSIYRVMVISRLNENTHIALNSTGPSVHLGDDEELVENSTQELNTETNRGEDDLEIDNDAEEVQQEPVFQFEMGSVASSNASTMSFSSVVKDFKSKLGEKKTPKNVILLNRFLMTFLIGAIILQVLDYMILADDVKQITKESYHNHMNEKRRIQQTQLAINVRSFINVANDMEFTEYDLPGMNSVISRYEYLGKLVQQQAAELEEVQDYMTSIRSEKDDNIKAQNQFESRLIELYRLDDSGLVSRYFQPYRVSLLMFLNEIQMLNYSSLSRLKFHQNQLLIRSPQEVLSILDAQNTTSIERSAYFTIANGLRNIRTRTHEASEFLKLSQFNTITQNSFLIIMIVAIVTTTLSLALLLFYLWQIERVQAEILSLYAHLHLLEVELVFQRCNNYLVELNDGTLIKHIIEHCHAFVESGDQGTNGTGADQDREDNYEKANAEQPNAGGIRSIRLALQQTHNEAQLAQAPPAVSALGVAQIGLQNQSSNQSTPFTRGRQLKSAITCHILEDSQVSEEDREEYYLKKYIKQKQMRRYQKNAANNNKDGSYQNSSKDFYEDMIASSYQYIRDIAEFEENNRNYAAERPQTVINFAKQFRATFASTYLKNSQVNIKGGSKANDKGLNGIMGAIGQGTHHMSAAVIFNPDHNNPHHARFHHKGEKHVRRSRTNLGKRGSLADEDSNNNHSDGEEDGGMNRNAEMGVDQELSHVDEESKDELENDENEKGGKKGGGIARQFTLKDLSDKLMQESNQLGNYNANNDLYQQNFKSRLRLSDDEILYRKRSFFKTINVQNWGSKISIFLTAILFCVYFLQLFFYQKDFLSNLQYLFETIPIFYNRFHYLMLSYALLKERILLNNSLFSFEKDADFGYNIDYLYNEQSTDLEKKLTILKPNSLNIAQPMADLFLLTDSTNFCNSVVSLALNDEEIRKAPSLVRVEAAFSEQLQKMYYTQIYTVIKACTAAEKGDIQTLQWLQGRGVDLSKGNYDLSSPLHIAVAARQVESVKFLLNVANVLINSQDRWGGTALNYLHPSDKEIESLLLNRGAKRGINQTFKESIKHNTTLSDNQVRLFYAAYYGDIKTIKALSEIGLSMIIIDRNGRTPLHIAACEGQRQASALIIALGGDISFQDVRGIDPDQDAHRENQLDVHEFLDSIIIGNIIQRSCLEFSDNIFSQGVQSAIASFHKKFLDLQIRVNQATSHKEMLAFLKSPLSINASNPSMQSIRQFYEAHELYLPLIITQLDSTIESIYTAYCSKYSASTQIIFIICLVLYIIILLVFRKVIVNRLKQEILQSRGILNLIPNSFFEQNKELVQGLIVKIQE